MLKRRASYLQALRLQKAITSHSPVVCTTCQHKNNKDPWITETVTIRQMGGILYRRPPLCPLKKNIQFIIFVTAFALSTQKTTRHCDVFSHDTQAVLLHNRFASLPYKRQNFFVSALSVSFNSGRRLLGVSY